MSSSPGIDTSTISPLVMPAATPSGYSPTPVFYTDSVPPMTLTDSVADSIIKTAAMNPTMRPPVLPVQPVTPSTQPDSQPSSPPMAIPDVMSMESELKATGALLTEVKVEAAADTSPLSHLQPAHLVETPEGPRPSFTSPTTPNSGQSIQLASTAPAMHRPTLTQIVYQSKAKAEQNRPAQNYVISGILMVLTVVSVLVLGIFLAQQYQMALDEKALRGDSEGSFLHFLIEKVPFLAKDTSTQSPEAVWYQ